MIKAAAAEKHASASARVLPCSPTAPWSDANDLAFQRVNDGEYLIGVVFVFWQPPTPGARWVATAQHEPFQFPATRSASRPRRGRSISFKPISNGEAAWPTYRVLPHL